MPAQPGNFQNRDQFHQAQQQGPPGHNQFRPPFGVPNQQHHQHQQEQPQVYNHGQRPRFPPNQQVSIYLSIHFIGSFISFSSGISFLLSKYDIYD